MVDPVILSAMILYIAICSRIPNGSNSIHVPGSKTKVAALVIEPRLQFDILSTNSLCNSC